jgi:N-hydroxyarylamine O-acetyltransferase
MEKPLDLDAYFDRIAYSGPRAPTLEVLRGLVARHIMAIPFENLDVLLGRGIDLADDAVERKLVTERRGGYCFEQNSLLLRVLTTMGYRATPLSARVRIGRPRDFTPPRTHLFLRVEIAGEAWLADVGVGGLSPTTTLRFDTEAEQPTPHEPRRIVREEGRWFHQARLGDTWTDVYEFTMEEMPPIDRELGNWFTSTHPASKFRTNLMVARAGEGGTRYSILNDEFTIRREAEGIVERRVIATPEQLLSLMEEYFGLRFPPETRFAAPGATWPV